MQFTRAPRLFLAKWADSILFSAILRLTYSLMFTVVLGLDLTLGCRGMSLHNNYLVDFYIQNYLYIGSALSIGGRLIAIAGVHVYMSDLIIARLSHSLALL